MEPLELEFTVGCPPEHAFAVWTERTSLWWPKGHSVSGDPELDGDVRAAPGGRIFERTPAGEEHDWGEIVEWEPPHRLAYRWHLRQDRADATRVEISFTPAAEGTAVTIVHGLGAPGSARRGLRERNGRGWGGLLPHFAAACDGPPVQHPPADLRATRPMPARGRGCIAHG